MPSRRGISPALGPYAVALAVCRALESLSKQQQKLALELKARARPGYDFGVPIRQITEEIAVIEAGLKRLIIAAKAA
jgi:hypothetical protein